MQVDIKEETNCSLVLEFCIGRDEVEEEIKNISLRYKNTRVAGFRAGRAPIEIIRGVYSKEIQEEAINNIIDRSYKKAIQDKKIHPVVISQAYDIRLSKEALKFRIVTEVLPVVSISSSDYKGIKLITHKIDIKEEDIQKELLKLQEKEAILTNVEDTRPATRGDIALVNIKAYVDNKLLIDRQNILLELGEDNILPGFDKEVEGMSKGQVKKFSLIAEKPLYIKDIKIYKKNIDFLVKLKELKVKLLPQIDDELAKEFQFDDISSLKEEIKKRLYNELKKKQEEELLLQLRDKLVKNINFPLPNSLLNIEIRNLYYALINNLRLSGIDEVEFFKIKNLQEKEIYDKMKGYAEKRLKLVLILKEIADKENITTEELEEKVEEKVEEKKIEEKIEGKIKEKIEKKVEEKEEKEEKIEEKKEEPKERRRGKEEGVRSTYQEWLYNRMGNKARVEKILKDKKENELFKEEFRIEKTLKFILKQACIIYK